MARYVALLRAINLGATRRVPMARLRELLADAGYEDVVTYLQSGNVLLTSTKPPEPVRTHLEELIADGFGFQVPTVLRTAEQLREVVEHDPFADVAAGDPKRYQVTFFDEQVPAPPLQELDRSEWGASQFHAHGRELYTWTPAGIRADRMLRDITRALDGLDGTARNWNTVLKLLDLAEER